MEMFDTRRDFSLAALKLLSLSVMITRGTYRNPFTSLRKNFFAFLVPLRF